MPTRPDRPTGRRPGCDPSPLVQWIGWHLGELAALAVPTVLALTVWSGFAVLAVLVAAGWLAHEVHLHRRRAALAAARRHVLTARPGTDTTPTRGTPSVTAPSRAAD